MKIFEKFSFTMRKSKSWVILSLSFLIFSSYSLYAADREPSKGFEDINIISLCPELKEDLGGKDRILKISQTFIDELEEWEWNVPFGSIDEYFLVSCCYFSEKLRKFFRECNNFNNKGKKVNLGFLKNKFIIKTGEEQIDLASSAHEGKKLFIESINKSINDKMEEKEIDWELLGIEFKVFLNNISQFCNNIPDEKFCRPEIFREFIRYTISLVIIKFKEAISISYENCSDDTEKQDLISEHIYLPFIKFLHKEENGSLEEILYSTVYGEKTDKSDLLLLLLDQIYPSKL